MHFIRSLWALTDNESMDVTQIESSLSLTDAQQEVGPIITQPTIQPKYDYSNVINLLDYLKVKNPAC